MITYKYECRACKHAFEAQQRMSDDAIVDCPQCDEPQLRIVIQPAPFKIEGSNGNYGRGRT